MSTKTQRSFAGGEIAPSLHANVDLTKYRTGLKTMRNFWVLRHGGAANRGGTYFVSEISNSAEKARLIPYVGSGSEKYAVCLAADGLLYQNGELVTKESLPITGITSANPAVVTYTGADPAASGMIYISGVAGTLGRHLNNRTFKYANLNAGANTLELRNMDGTNFDSTGLAAYTSGGTAEKAYPMAFSYTEAELFDVGYAQRAGEITWVHPSHAPRYSEITAAAIAAGTAQWTAVNFGTERAAPTGLAESSGTSGSVQWTVTAVDATTKEETVGATPVNASAIPTAGAANTLTWNAVTNASEYKVYRGSNGIYGYIGSSDTTTFVDTGYAEDFTVLPPVEPTVFSSTDNYPATVGYAQGRRYFANTNNDPEMIHGSKVGLPNNFNVHTPIADDDPAKFALENTGAVKNIADLGGVVVFGEAGEVMLEGNEAGYVTPDAVNPKRLSANGSKNLPPLIVNATALFLQARGSIVRDLAFVLQTDGYSGNDLTVFAAHLFDGYTIVDWAFQQTPNSIVWAVRNDGVLIGVTYNREHEIVGCHRHDTDGLVESVCVVPENTTDAVYLIVKRTINGEVKRYVERMAERHVTDVVDSVIMDSALTYDGRNTDDTHTMTLSGGTTWSNLETLTLTSSDPFFAASDVGNAIHFQLLDDDGEVEDVLRFTITAYTSSTVVSGKAHKTVQTDLRSVAASSWSKAVDEVSGLWHLEGKDVSIFADGFVVASPNNSSYVVRTVEDGAVALDKPYSVIHVGLPIISDLQTLDLDYAEEETLADKKVCITDVTFSVEASRGIWVGPQPPEEDLENTEDDPLFGLSEARIRNFEKYDDPVSLKTGKIDVTIHGHWSTSGSVFVRQVDPLPLTVLAIHPAGYIPRGR